MSTTGTEAATLYEERGTPNDELLNREVTIAFGPKADAKYGWRNQAFTVGRLVARLSQAEYGQKDGKGLLQGALADGANERQKKNAAINYSALCDFDTGVNRDELISAIERRGLFAIIYSTHSHGKNISSIPEQALERYLKQAGTWPGHVGNVETEHCVAYLREVKRYLARVLVDAELVERKMSNGGVQFFVRHQALPRYRVMFILEKPFDFANRTGSQAEAMAEWTGRYTALTEELGLPCDSKCSDPARFMYTWRIPGDSKLGPGKHEFIVIHGKALDFEALPYTPQAKRGGAGNQFTRAAGNAGTSDEIPADVRAFLVKHRDFKAADYLRSLEYTSLGDHPDGGMETHCPHAESHSTGEKGFVVFNNGDSGEWWSGCQHENCKRASGEDRFWYITRAMEKAGVGVESLIEYSETATAERDAEAAAEKAAEDAEEAIDNLSSKSAPDEIEAVVKALAIREDSLALTKQLRRISKKTKLPLADLRRSLKNHAKGVKGTNARGRGGDLRDDTSAIWREWPIKDQVDAVVQKLLDRQKNNPRIFSRLEDDGVKTVRLEEVGGRMVVAEMDRDSWTETLIREGIVFRKRSGAAHDIAPPKEIVSSLLRMQDKKWPRLESVVRVPVFASDGSLITQRGYVPELKVYLDPDFEPIQLPERIEDEHINRAIELIFDNALRDFPFSDEFDGNEPLPVKVGEVLREDGYRQTNRDRGWCSRLNMLAMLLQPIARYLIKGPVPLYHIDKGRPGEGAGYLMDVLGFILEGDRATAIPEAETEAEFRKNITANLRERTSVAFFDNINHPIDSGVLASALTAGRWKDRVLGQTKTTGALPIDCVWVIAGNTIHLTPELARRVVPIRIDSGVPRPELRHPSMFWHHPLHDWLREHRRELVWACHVLIANWIQSGRKAGSVSLASFDAYASVMSGIMEAIELEGFLGNTASYVSNCVPAQDSAADAMQQAFDAFGGTPFTSGELYEDFKNVMSGGYAGPLSLSGKDESAQKTSLGMHLGKLCRTPFDLLRKDGTPVRVRLLKHDGGRNQSKWYFSAMEEVPA